MQVCGALRTVREVSAESGAMDARHQDRYPAAHSSVLQVATPSSSFRQPAMTHRTISIHKYSLHMGINCVEYSHASKVLAGE
jgi:hypothetical protein